MCVDATRTTGPKSEGHDLTLDQQIEHPNRLGTPQQTEHGEGQRRENKGANEYGEECQRRVNTEHF